MLAVSGLLVTYVRFGKNINRILYFSPKKQDYEFVQGFQFHFGFDNLVTVDPIGTSGGLALFIIMSIKLR